MRARYLRTIALSAVIVTACGVNNDDPVSVARAFVRETKGEGCGHAFDYFTPEVQENARQASHNARRNQPYVTEHTLPERIFCSGYGDIKPRSIRVSRLGGDTAHLAAIASSGTHFPIIPFLSDPYKERPAVLDLVKTASGWRVTRPLVQVTRPGIEAFEYGPITVNRASGGNREVEGFRVDGPVVASPEDVEAVLLDYEHWPKWVPYLVESRVVKADPQRRDELIYGRYELSPGGPSAAYLFNAHISLRVQDQEFRGFGGGWYVRPVRRTVEIPPDAPKSDLTVWGYTIQYRRAVWVRPPGTPMTDTVRVSLSYSAKPKEWPTELAAKIISPDFGASLLQGLQREAQARAAGRR